MIGPHRLKKAHRIGIGLGAAFFVALVAEALGLRAPWVGFASSLFIWTILSEDL
jgi:hypothetical protein